MLVSHQIRGVPYIDSSLAHKYKKKLDFDFLEEKGKI